MSVEKGRLIAALRREMSENSPLGEEMAYQIEMANATADDADDAMIVDIFEGLIGISRMLGDATILEPAAAGYRFHRLTMVPSMPTDAMKAFRRPPQSTRSKRRMGAPRIRRAVRTRSPRYPKARRRALPVPSGR